MRDQALFDKIDLHLIRVLHTVLTERSVSRAAMRLGMYQPAVSAALKRLRELAGDPLLVRSGAGMVPTDAGLRMIEPGASILRAAECCSATPAASIRPPPTSTFRLAASDYLDPHVPARSWWRDSRRQAPPLPDRDPSAVARADYHAHLAQGDVDVVIGNWVHRRGDLHRGRAVHRRGGVPGGARSSGRAARLDARRTGSDAEHIAPTPTHPARAASSTTTWQGLGLVRNITARCAHFGLIPAMVAASLLVLTTGRPVLRALRRAACRWRCCACPVPFPPLTYYQLWHERTHASAAARWLREPRARPSAGRAAAATTGATA